MYIDSLCDVMQLASQDAAEATQAAVRELRDALIAFHAAKAAYEIHGADGSAAAS